MFDIETIGTDAEAVIVSVGVCCFNKEGILSKREWVLDMDEQKARGRTEDKETLLWWSKQSGKAKAVFLVKNRIKALDFIEELLDYLTDNCMSVGETFKDLKPVGNCACFDITILEHFFKMFVGKKKIPWQFWNILSFRTANYFFKLKDKVKREGTYHNAADDAEYQAKCWITLWSKKEPKNVKSTK